MTCSPVFVRIRAGNFMGKLSENYGKTVNYAGGIRIRIDIKFAMCYNLVTLIFVEKCFYDRIYKCG